MRRRALRRVRALSVGVALLALLVGALVLWRRGQERTASDVITRPAPELDPTAQVLLPGLEDAVVVVPDRPHEPDELRSGRIARTRSFHVRTNRLGLRGPEIEARAAGPRVLAVGDSVTFGWGVAEEESWPARLAVALGVEVLNGGVPAQRPPAIAAWTAANAPSLDVDLVLFARRPDQREPDPIASYAAAIGRVRAALPGVPIGVILPPLSTFDPDGIARGPAEVAALRAALGGVPLLDLTPAFRAATPERGVILEVEGGLQRMLRLPGRALVREAEAPERGLAPALREAFERDSTIREPLFFDGGHPDADGFALFAEEVARWVRVEGLLAGPQPPTTEGAAPLIPANAPEWARDPPPFVEDPAFYGEASWDDVRGRVIQHQATVLRDRARLAARGGDLALAARRYAETVGWMEAHPVASGVGAELHRRYLAALRRDAALSEALAAGRAPPVPEAGLARLRALLLGGADRATLEAASREIVLEALDPSSFRDFADRHALRLALVDAALDALDPLALPDTWGSWDPASREATRASLLAAIDGPRGLPRWARPARHLPRAAARFSAEGLGALPTGDSWVDTGAEPGPAAIGRLEVLSLEDPAHRAWLEAEAARLQSTLERDPRAVAAALAPTLAALEAQPYTSRYYNLKQARNEAVRQLARAGAHAEAAALLEGAFPLHRQDLACPNRAGILHGLYARLLALADDPRADAAMREALADGEAFLASIDRADRR